MSAPRAAALRLAKTMSSRRRAQKPVVQRKAVKTGMVLARVQVAQSQSGGEAARERHAALVSKGKDRNAESGTRESSPSEYHMGMPKKRLENDAARFKSA